MGLVRLLICIMLLSLCKFFMLLTCNILWRLWCGWKIVTISIERDKVVTACYFQSLFFFVTLQRSHWQCAKVWLHDWLIGAMHLRAINTSNRIILAHSLTTSPHTKDDSLSNNPKSRTWMEMFSHTNINVWIEKIFHFACTFTGFTLLMKIKYPLLSLLPPLWFWKHHNQIMRLFTLWFRYNCA